VGRGGAGLARFHSAQSAKVLGTCASGLLLDIAFLLLQSALRARLFKRVPVCADELLKSKVIKGNEVGSHVRTYHWSVAALLMDATFLVASYILYLVQVILAAKDITSFRSRNLDSTLFCVGVVGMYSYMSEYVFAKYDTILIFFITKIIFKSTWERTRSRSRSCV
jgi:hypothetical protein